jgi:hypothetical protein
LHGPTIDDLVKSTFSALSFTRMEALRDAAREFRQVLWRSGSPAARASAANAGRRVLHGAIDTDNSEPTELGAVVLEVAGRAMYVAHGCAFVRIAGELLALSRSDLQRVHQFLTGTQSGLFATTAQAAVAPGPERTMVVAIAHAYEAQVSRLLEGSRRIPMGDEVSLCKAFKRAFSAYLGELSGPLCSAEAVELWREARGTKHAPVLDLDGWVGEIRKWTAGTSFNLGKVYKLCPAPDASPGLTLIERHEMVCNHNTPLEGWVERLAVELRTQILRSYIRVPGVKLAPRAQRPAWYGAYRSGKYDDVPSDQIHTYLAWEGTATMPPRSPDNPALWKDSGLGWDSVELAHDPRRNKHHGNMLTRMVFDSAAPMPGIRHMGHPRDHKIDIKPEGHKDPARGIYSGNLRDRLNQSWMEAAVQTVCEHHPAYMIGADAETRDSRVRAIVDRPHDLNMVALYYSFDIAGWSPRMAPAPQHASHAIWADLYNEELFRTASLITDGSRVYMNKQGFSGWYVNPGANFEGYNGKEMTMILVSLMSLTVKEWRLRIVADGVATNLEAESWAALLLAYIDDGLTKMLLPRARAVRLFTIFKECTEEVFAWCGYTVERSKCYPSDRFAIFLNEPYLAGRHVTHGTRAAMTICAENTEEHTSLIERTTAVSTGCRGAVMAGLDAVVGVMLQAYHTYGHILEWIRNPEPVAAAVWSSMPRAWGGLGMPTALQLGTSGGGSAFEESVRTMQRWATVSTPARRVFLSRAREMLKPRNATGVLMAPLGGRACAGVMVETRVPDAVREALDRLRRAGGLSVLAMDFLGYSSPESLDSYADALLPLQSDSIIQEQVLVDLANAHPHSLFSAFASRIEKSTTLMQLVGQKEVRSIIRRNRQDAAESYSTLISLLTV